MTKPYLASKTPLPESVHDNNEILGVSHIRLSRANKDRVLKHSNNNEDLSKDRKISGHCKDSTTINNDSVEDRQDEVVVKDQNEGRRRECETCTIYYDGLRTTTITPPETNRTGTGRKSLDKKMNASDEIESATITGEGRRDINKKYGEVNRVFDKVQNKNSHPVSKNHSASYTDSKISVPSTYLRRQQVENILASILKPSSTQKGKKTHLAHSSAPHQGAKREKHQSRSKLSNVSHSNASGKSSEINKNKAQLLSRREDVVFQLERAMDDLTFGLLSALPCAGKNDTNSVK
jgi:hypothetical protein